MMHEPQDELTTQVPSLADIGLHKFAPYLLNRIMGRYNLTLRDDLKKQGLTVPQVRAMAAMSVMDNITVNDLAIYAVIEQSTMSRTLDGLEAQGLVRRDACDQDSRVKYVSLTKRGRSEFATAWPIMERSFGAMFKDVDAVEYASLIRTLQKMLNNIRQHKI